MQIEKDWGWAELQRHNAVLTEAAPDGNQASQARFGEGRAEKAAPAIPGEHPVGSRKLNGQVGILQPRQVVAAEQPTSGSSQIAQSQSQMTV